MASQGSVLCGLSGGLFTNAVGGLVSNVQYTWPAWNQAYTSAGSNITTQGVYYNVRPIWIQQQTASHAGQINTLGSAAITASDSHVTWQQWNVGIVCRENEAERRAREAEAQRVATLQAEARARAKRIHAIALDLLLKHLDPNQREQFEKQKQFEVIGKSGKYRYQISERGDVKRIDEKGPVESYCIHPPYEIPENNLPGADLALAKKLMLELNEDLFLKTANATRLRA